MTCNERFARMCSSSSDWAECLEKNKTSLVLAGCNITLESDESSSGSSASETDTSTGGASTGDASTGGASTGGASTGDTSTGGTSTGDASTGDASTGGASGFLTKTMRDIFGYAPHQQCPDSDKYIVNGNDDENVACSNDPTNVNDACALKGYTGIQSKPLLRRCYEEKYQKPNGDKFTCINNEKIGNINKYVMSQYGDNVQCDIYDESSKSYKYNADSLIKV